VIADKRDDATAGDRWQSVLAAIVVGRENGSVVRGCLVGNLFHDLPHARKKNFLFEPQFQYLYRTIF
jgi:hypothetical protein